MTMKFLSSIFLLTMMFAVSCSFGQEAKKEKGKTTFAAKLFGVSNFQDPAGLILGRGVEVFKSFSPTINWGKEFGNYHEVQLTDFSYKNNDLFKELQIGSMYSYNLRLFSKLKASKFSCFIGAGAGFRYDNYPNRNSESSLHYSNSAREFKLNTIIIPRVNYNIVKRVYLDLNIGYTVFSYSWSASETKNLYRGKISSVRDNRSKAFLDHFSVNVGIAIKF